ncbi:MAG: long-chain-acyl-CoA synthetase, partial [Halioglobus sp.]|nr:long-chain-acyl-CoA synthetase [Halioglobus sp.]
EAWLYVADSGQARCPDWASDLMAEAANCDSANPPDTQERTHSDTALYIYTSGTTGFPKAAVLSNRRFLVSSGISHMGGLNLTAKDRVYLCLPLYHGTGLFLGAAAACRSGACIILRRRFSASNFLPDIREHRATSFVYIGELCRYLLNTPEKMDDHKTTLTKVMGNGLRPDIWHEFKSRFGLQRVAEFYGSSEGNIAFVNFLNKDCTVGTTVMPLALVEYDVDEDEIVRDANGHCIRVQEGEPGLLLGPITDETVFEGYTSSEETEKKILRDVFEKGDAWFNTGDLMRTVDVGYALNFEHFQFVDRVGDTFRWKSENVSTNEVGEIINGFHQVAMCNVYGVEIPGADGKAGMASIILGADAKEFAVGDFSSYVESELPPYARPVFLRVQREMDTTGTFKMLKGDLRKQGYDPDQVSDPLYVMKPRENRYELLDHDYYTTLRAGSAGY